MRIKKAADIKSSGITDEQVYQDRRRFIQLAGGAALALGAAPLLQACSSDPEAADFARNFLDLVRRARRHRDLHSRVGKLPRDSRADPAAPARDERDLSVHPVRHGEGVFHASSRTSDVVEPEPPERAGRRDAASSVAPVFTNTNAPCVLV